MKKTLLKVSGDIANAVAPCFHIKPVNRNGKRPRVIKRKPLFAVFFLIMPFTQLVSGADLGAGFSACEGPDCPATYLTTGQLCGGAGIIGADAGFSVFVGGDMTITGNGPAESEGVVAVGGNMRNEKTSGAYNFGAAGAGSCVTAPSGSTHLFVGGNSSNVVGAGNMIVGSLGVLGNAELGDFTSSASYTFGAGGGQLALSDTNLTTTIANKIDEFKTISQCLVDFDPNTDTSDSIREATFTSSFGTITLDCLAGDKTAGKCDVGTYMVTIDGTTGADNLALSYVSNIDTLSNFVDDGNTTIIVNVTEPGDLEVRAQPAGAAFNSTFARNLLWNFQTSDKVRFEGGAQFNGAVLIPNGSAEIRASGMNGRLIIGEDLIHDQSGSELHNFDFAGSIPDACAAGTPPGAASSVSVGDLVWFDSNGNGEQDSGERGIGGVTVNLLDGTGASVNTTQTDQTGKYFFTTNSAGALLQAGNYQVEFVAPPGMDFTLADQGSDDADDSDVLGPVTALSGSTLIFNVPDNTNDVTRDAGVVLENNAVCLDGGGNDDLGGNVFRDFNADGADAGGSEPAFNGITVKAYNNDNVLVASTTVLPNGSYNLPDVFASEQHIRLEFENLPDYMKNSVAGMHSGTATQFHSAATCNADFALFNPGEFCNSNPTIGLACYINGDTDDATVENMIAFKEFDYASEGSAVRAVNGNAINPVEFQNASAEQVGTTWGMTFHREDETILLASMLKRHSGLYTGTDTSNSISTLFKAPRGLNYNDASGGGEVWLDGAAVGMNADINSLTTNKVTGATFVPSNVDRDLTDAFEPSVDAVAYPLIGKVGFGDMDISDDEKTVYVVNLSDRKLYAIDYDSVTSPTTATLSSIAIPEADCVNGESRPWAIDVHDGKIYVGTVCSGELETNTVINSLNTLGLTAQVYVLTPDADPAVGSVGSFNPVPVIQFPLDYDGTNNNADKGCTGSNEACQWAPWLDVYSDAAMFTPYQDLSRPTPILSDIVIEENGFMVLSFMDRTGHQLGWNNYRPTGAGATLRAPTGGDILLASPNDLGGWTIESDGSAGSRTSGGTGNSNRGAGGVNANQGPDMGEFFSGDFLARFHSETSQGGLAYFPGSGEVMNTKMDPLAVRSSGVSASALSDGNILRLYEIFPAQDQNNIEPRFGKAGSLGDVELLCGLAPIEIGNRIWADNNMNGVQDPCENPIAGVEVQLYEWNDAISAGGNGDGIYDANEIGAAVMQGGNPVTATTNIDGEYYFGARSGDPNLGFVGSSGLDPMTKYVVAIDSTQAALALTPNTSPLTASVAAAAVGETNAATSTATNGTHDSNGLEGIETDLIIAPLMTGVAGENDHTYDFGFFGSDLGDAPDTYRTTLASGGPVHPIDTNLRIGAELDSEDDGVPSVGADGDDSAGSPDDEDGIDISAQTPLTTTNAVGVLTSTYTLQNIAVVNNTGENAFLVGYIDFNRDGDFDDPGERSVNTSTAITTSGNVNLTFNGISDLSVGDSYLRLRLSSEESDVTSPGGQATKGEIEDHPITILPMVRVQKVLIPETVSDRFDLTVGGTMLAAAGNGDSTAYVPFGTPAIEISEAPVATNSATYITELQCVDANGATVFPAALSTLTIMSSQLMVLGNSAAENTITCTFRNTNETTVAIVKTATPANSTDFSFTSSKELSDTGTIPLGNFTLDGEFVDSEPDGNTNQISAMGNLPLGPVTFTEVAPSGWLVIAASCNDVASGVGSIPQVVPGTISANSTMGVVVVDVAAGDTITCNFENVQTVSLGSVIWNDGAIGVGNISADGMQQENESGIPGAMVTLIDNATNAVAIDPATGLAYLPVTTGTDGSYNFNGMLPGDYRISVTLPAANSNFVPTPVQEPNANTDVNNDSNIETINDASPATLPYALDSTYVSGVISLSVGGEPENEAATLAGASDSDQPGQGVGTPGELQDNTGNMTLDMGFLEVVSLGSTIWFDANANGVQELNEPPLAGVQVSLRNTDGSEYDSDLTTPGTQALVVTTDVDGQYNFNGLPPGDYRVQADLSGLTAGGTVLVPSLVQVPDPDAATDDNADSNVDDTAPGHSPASDVYQSGVVSLAAGQEPVNEQDLIGNPSPAVVAADQPGQAATTGQPALPDNSGNMTVDMGFYTPLSLGSTVWFDSNTDGLQTDGEPGIAGATVTLQTGTGALYDGDPSTPALDAVTAITNAQGEYNFNGLPAGDYQVLVDVTDVGTVSSFDGTVLIPTINQMADPDPNPNDGSDINNDSNIASENLALDEFTSGVITLGSVASPLAPVTEPLAESDGIPSVGADQPNQTNVPDNNGNMTLDMGFIAPVSLGSTIWEDLNGNGIQDPQEPPIENARVTLLNADGTDYDSIPATPAIDSLVVDTNADGEYFFNSLVPGDYRIEVDLQAVPVVGGGDLFPTPEQEPDANTDVNSDSNYDSAAPGDDPSNQSYRSGVISLAAGSEPLLEDDPIDGTAPVGNIADQPMQTASQPDDSGNMTLDMGFVRPVSLGSTIWFDVNANGIQDDNEVGINNATVSLVDALGAPIPGVADTLTNPQGEYKFNDLPPGDYRVQVNLATATFAGPAPILAPTPTQVADPDPDQNPATQSNSDSNIDRAIDGNISDQIHFSGEITLTAGGEPTLEMDPIDESSSSVGMASDQPMQAAANPDNSGNMTLDMGFFEPVSLGSTLWFDSNVNGQQDPGEPPIINAQVTLFTGSVPGTLYDDDPTLPLTQALVVFTDSQGQYNFNGLPPGEYIVSADLSTVTNFDSASLRPTLNQVAMPDSNPSNLDSNIASSSGSVFNSGPVDLMIGMEPENEQDPIGLGVLADDVPNQGVLVDSNGNMTVDMGFYIPVSLGSVVWEDLNGNGLQDLNETPIQGAEVRLLNADGTVYDSDTSTVAIDEVTDTTDMDGLYNFNTLRPGDYRVEVDLSMVVGGSDLFPTPFQIADPDEPGPSFDDNTDSNIDIPFDQAFVAGGGTSNQVHYSGIVTLFPGSEEEDEASSLQGGAIDSDQPNQALTAVDQPDNTGNMTVDMGFVRPVSLGSTIWEDININGLQDDAEPGIENATVTLLDANDLPVSGVAPVFTNENGEYHFNGLAPGSYRVQVDLSSVVNGEGLMPSPIQMASPEDDDANIQNDNDDSNIDLAADFDPGDQVHVSGVVILTRGEEPIDEEDFVDGTDGNAIASDQPNQGLTPTAQPDNSGNMTVDMGFYQPVSLGSTIWFDSNSDGLQSAGEPAIPGVTVKLLDDNGMDFDSDPSTPGTQVLSVLSDASGQYNFNGLPAGSYIVEVSVLSATGGFNGAALRPTPAQVADTNGDPSNSDSNIASMPAAGVFRSGVVILDAGTEPTGETDLIGVAGADQPNQTVLQPDQNGNMTVDMGFIAPVSLGSTVWEDSNVDGVQTSGEPPVQGALVTLLIADGSLYDSQPNTPGDQTLTDTTDVNGEYNFDDLPPGEYRVQVDVSGVAGGESYIPTPTQTAEPDALAPAQDDNTDSNIDAAADSNPNDSIFISGAISLSVGDEPTGETDAIGTGPDDQPGQGLTPEIDPDNAGNMTLDIGLIKPVSLGSTVWLDTNSDGDQDSGESPVVNAEVTLLTEAGAVYDSNPNVAGTQPLVDLTDVSGQYNFNELPPGRYRVQVNLATVSNANAASFIPTPRQVADPSTDSNSDSNIDVAADPNPADQTHISGVIELAFASEPATETDSIGVTGADQPNQGLTAADQPDTSGNMTLDMGFIEPVSLGSTIWLDSNSDGTQDSGEPPIEGVTVRLLDSSGMPVDSDPFTLGVQPTQTVTDANGQYNFNQLPVGDYIVEVDVSSSAGGINGASLRPSPSQVADPNTNANDDSNVATTSAANVYRSGIVSLAVNQEPVGETDDIGVPGADQPNQTSAQPDANGNMTVDMGFFAPVSLGSTVWEDTNGNGVQDSGELPIAQAQVTLALPDGTPYDSDLTTPEIDELTVSTDADGQYNFNDIPPGDYRVRVDLSTVPNGGDLFPTPVQVADPDVPGDAAENAQDDSNLDVAFDPDSTDQIHFSGVVTLTVGGEPSNEQDPIGTPGADQPNQALTATDDPDNAGNMTVDMGFVRPVSLGSTLWFDIDRDGTQDDNEPPIQGVTVTLLDAAGAPVPTVNPVTTDDQGQYNFNGLAPGDYRVKADFSSVGGSANVQPSPVQVADPDAIGNDNTDSNIDVGFDTDTTDGMFFSGIVSLSAGDEPVSEVDAIDGVDSNGPVADQPNQGANDPDSSGNMTVDMGFFTPVSIGSFVWKDNDGDGIQDANEPPLAGTRVELLVEDAAAPGTFVAANDVNGLPVAAITVGPDGLYNFANLPSGKYKVRATPPNGFIPSVVQTSADDDNTANDSNIAAETSSGSGVFDSGVFTLLPSLAPIEANDTERGDNADGALGGIADSSGNMTVDFGFTPTATIGNYVWLDLDMDGVQDANEDGIPGVRVTLTPPPGVDIGEGVDQPVTVTTGPNGEYLFPNLPPFADSDDSVGYVVTVDPSSVPPALLQTYDEGETGVIGVLDNSSNPIQLTPNEEHLTADFGYAPPVGSLGDTVWVDANDDGIQNPGEPGIPGVTVTLQPAPDVDPDGSGPAGPGEPITVVTDQNGKYLFDGLPLNETYVITVTGGVPNEYSFSSSGNGDPDVRDGNSTPQQADQSTLIVLTDEIPVNLNADFGYLPDDSVNNSIGDTIWRDTNRDGVIDANEPRIPGVTVTLLNEAGEAIATTITDSEGKYLFTGVPDASSASASYTVRVTDQNNVLDGLIQTYDDDDATGPVFATPGTSVVTGLGVGVDTPDEDLDQDFGYVDASTTTGPGVIGDTVFFDTDDNGQVDDGEGIEGVTVKLIGPGPDGDINTSADNVLLATDITDESGNYLFSGLGVTGSTPGAGIDYLVMIDTSSLPNGGNGWSNTVDPDTAGNGDSMSVVRLTSANPEDLDQDFGYLGRDGNSLAGTVWPDTNGDGQQEEAGIFAGVTIEVRDENGNVIRRIKTDSDGSYEVNNLPDGRYVVVVTDEDNVLNGFGHTDSPMGSSDTSDQTSKDDTGYVIDLDSAGLSPTPVRDVTGDFGYQPVVTNPISLGSFFASVQSDGSVLIEWETQTEVANLGFNVYGQVDGQWQQINAQMIIAHGDSVQLQSYRFRTQTVFTTFALSDVDMTGKETLHGPFELGRRFGSVAERQSIDWQAERAERELKKANRLQRRAERQKQRSSKNASASPL